MGIKIIADNKKSRFDYELLEKFEAGLVLTGSEVKSLRNGQITLKDSYISFRDNEAYLQNAHISEYKASSYNNHEPERLRKLLMSRVELDRLSATMNEKGLALIPTKIYFKNGRVKLEIALGRGKKHFDKRESSKKRDVNRELQRASRRSRG